MAKANSQSDFVVTTTLDPTIKFQTLSGGRVAREVRQVQPGGKGRPYNVKGPASVEQITISKAYDRVRDRALMIRVKEILIDGRDFEVDVTQQAIKSNGRVEAGTVRFLGCEVVDAATPDFNSDSAEPGMITITLQPTTKE